MTIFGIIFFICVFIIIFIPILSDVYIDFIEGLFFSTIITLATFLVIVGLSFIGIHREVDTSQHGRINISSLSTNSNINGEFFLGCGTVDEEQYYYFVRKFNDNTYKIDKIEVYNVYLCEDEETNPYIEFVYRKCVKQSFFSKIFFKPSFYYQKDYKQIIHVPKNTIVKNYNVNISNL